MECDDCGSVVDSLGHLVCHDSTIHDMNHMGLKVGDHSMDPPPYTQICGHPSLETLHKNNFDFQANSPQAIYLLFDEDAQGRRIQRRVYVGDGKNTHVAAD